MVSVDTISLQSDSRPTSIGFVQGSAARSALFYVRELNRVNCRNRFSMTTAPVLIITSKVLSSPGSSAQLRLLIAAPSYCIYMHCAYCHAAVLIGLSLPPYCILRVRAKFQLRIRCTFGYP